MKKGALGGIVLGVVIVAGLVCVAKCTTKVPAGYVAVQYRMGGGISDEVLTQGFHLTSPTVQTTLYTVGIEQSYLTSEDKGDSPKDESFTASSKEGKALGIDLTYTYQYQSDKVTQVFNQFKGADGKSVRDSFIKPNIVSWTKEVLAKYKVSDILGEKKSEVNIALTDYISSKFDPYGITVSNVSLINITVDDKTQEAINNKITAQQEQETQAINNQTAIDKAEADRQVAETQAKAEAEQTRIKAQAQADSTRIRAEAQAQANKEIAESLTQELLENNKISTWDGKLPAVQSGNAATFIDAGDLIGGEE